MKSTLQILALGTAVVLGGATLSIAQGQGQDGDMRPTFDEIDANADGKIEKAEMMQMPTRMFQQADTDGDGKISREELITRMQAQVEQRADRMLARLDTDEDGALSEDEMRDARKNMKDRSGKDDRKGKKDRKGGKDRMDRGDRMERMFDRADTNGDGALDKAEFDAAGEKMGRKGDGMGKGQQQPVD